MVYFVLDTLCLLVSYMLGKVSLGRKSFAMLFVCLVSYTLRKEELTAEKLLALFVLL
jgi:hypothetical protein